MSATAARLPGNRLHLQHGPIDLVIGADGEAAEIERAYAAAWSRFPSILPGLVEALPLLRTPVRGPGASPWRGARGAAPLDPPSSPVARRMLEAVWPYRDVFITPMAAVAGAVAEEVLGAMTGAARLRRAYVNNGGDIAIHLAEGAEMTVGVVADLAAPAIDARVALRHEDPIRGIATSGWRGRSLSLGIADAVTVLAATAAGADAGATMIANAVDVDDDAIRRLPAREIREESDLGDLLVTVEVGALSEAARTEALERGARRARELRARGLVHSAFLALQGASVAVGPEAAPARLPPRQPARTPRTRARGARHAVVDV